MTVAARGRYLEQSEWLSPTNIDNSGSQNVSDALSDWLASSGHDGDLFRLRTGTYSIPQGIRIARPLRLDLNGAWLLTGNTLGTEDANLAANTLTYPPLWDDWSDVDTVSWPRSRVTVRVVSNDVSIYSSAAGARIIGAGRKVLYRGGNTNVPEGIEFNSTYEGQHGIRIGYKPGGSFISTSRIDIDLTNISVEFMSGDGIYLMGNTHDVTIHGAQAGPAVVNANTFVAGGDPNMGATGGLPDTITVGGGLGGSYDVWNLGLTGYPGIHHIGRQGIAFTFGASNVTIRDMSIWRIGRSAIDVELGTGANVDGLNIQRVEFGHWYLGHINNPYDGDADNVLIEDCLSYKQFHVVCATEVPTPARRANWTIRRNRARFQHETSGGFILALNAVDGLTINDNYGTVDASGIGISTGDSTSVTVSPAEDTQFVPTAQLVSCGAFAGLAAAVAGAGGVSR